MKLIIDSQLTLTDIPEEFKLWFMEQLTFDNPVYLEAVKRGRYTRNIPEYLTSYRTLPNGIVVPRGYLQVIEDAFIGQGYGVDIVDNRVLTAPIKTESSIKLFPYQAEAKYKILSHPNGMLIAPAASGKTIMGLDIIASTYQKALWITHTDRLAKQVIDRIVGTDDMPAAFPNISREDIGMLGGGKFKIGDHITIGMVPTLVRRDIELLSIGKEFGIVILDEAHHAPASTFLRVLSYFSSFYMYGLTATPHRRDKLENLMFAAIGMPNSKIFRKTVKKEGKIITPKVIVRKVPSMVIETNDFQYIMREIIPANKGRLEMIVKDIVREAKDGNYCIVISTRKNYCEMLFEKLKQELPDKIGIATGDYRRTLNDNTVSKIESGEFSVLVTTFELLGEGFDVRKLNRGFIALPFREKSRVEQAVGRIQRTCENKKDAILYDYVDENIGILKNQFLHRALTYSRLGMEIIND